MADLVGHIGISVFLLIILTRLILFWQNSVRSMLDYEYAIQFRDGVKKYQVYAGR